MKYIITNGNEYISVLQLQNDSYIVPEKGVISVDSFLLATKFKYSAAVEFMQKHLHSDPKWDTRKICKVNSGKNYVITTGNQYVTNTSESGITQNFQKAKWFRSLADAEAYLAKHKNVFESPVILDENMERVELSARKTFTDEQLAEIGKLNDVATKRIIIPKTTRQKVYENGHGICAICGRPVEYEKFTIDHIVPISRGGSNRITNLQIACEGCNKLKSNWTEGEFATSLTSILSTSLENKPNKELSDMLIRSIVRSQINQMFTGTCYQMG